MDLNLNVNLLPVRTYNWLKLNDDTIDEQNISISRLSFDEPIGLPKGVTLSKACSEEMVKEIFEEASKEAADADSLMDRANGDSSSHDLSQIVRTGMGIEVDNLMDEMGVKTDIYTVSENARPLEALVINNKLLPAEGVLGRQVIVAKENSEITVIMKYSSESDNGFNGVSTRLYAESGAKINLIKIQMLGKNVVHFDDIGGVCDNRGEIDIIQMELGASKAWDGCYINLRGRESVFDEKLGYLCRKNQKFDLNYVADQRGKKTQSDMIFHGVLLDESCKKLRGTIDFKNGSTGSVGNEQEDTLQLSDDVINKTIPIILCQEEVVAGRHGATIGKLGEDLLFYMQSRGIDETAAKKIMIRARLKSIYSLISDENLRHEVSVYIDQAL